MGYIPLAVPLILELPELQTNLWFRTSLHYFPCFAFIDGVKECGGYTVVLLLVTMEEKSVGYTVFVHLNEGRKECGYTVFLHLNEGRKECGGTLFFSILRLRDTTPAHEQAEMVA